MSKPTKQRPQRKSPRKEAIAKIAAENRAHFEKEDAKKTDLPPAAKRLDVATLEAQVREKIESQWQRNPATNAFPITNFSLVHESGNKYVGLLDYKISDNSQTLQIIVIYDGRGWVADSVPQPVQLNPIVPMPDNIPFPAQNIPIPAMPVLPIVTGNCPVCGVGNLVKLNSAGRTRAFWQGNLFGGFMKTHQCNNCGHLV